MDYHKNEEKLQDIAVCDMRGVHRNVVVPKCEDRRSASTSIVNKNEDILTELRGYP